MLTILCTISLFLFQVANATFQPANRIDPNAADQQGSVVGAHWGWALLVVAIFSALLFIAIRWAKQKNKFKTGGTI